MTRQVGYRTSDGRKSKETTDSSDQEDAEAAIRKIGKFGSKAMLDVSINNEIVEMIYDPGAVQTVINRTIWEQIGSPKLKPTRDLLAYTNVPITTLGTTTVMVSAFGKTLPLQLCVVDTQDAPLFGFSWAMAFNLPMPEGARICKVQCSEDSR
ncbi:unnamed protein product, partial [Nesidiocoris tenuis]